MLHNFNWMITKRMGESAKIMLSTFQFRIHLVLGEVAFLARLSDVLCTKKKWFNRKLTLLLCVFRRTDVRFKRVVCVKQYCNWETTSELFHFFNCGGILNEATSKQVEQLFFISLSILFFSLLFFLFLKYLSKSFHPYRINDASLTEWNNSA